MRRVAGNATFTIHVKQSDTKSKGKNNGDAAVTTTKVDVNAVVRDGSKIMIENVSSRAGTSIMWKTEFKFSA